MRNVVIVSAVRTPFGAFGGTLKDFQVSELGSLIIKGVLSKVEINKEEVDEVILGNVLPVVENGGNPARIAALKAGLPFETPAWTLNINCGSGLQAINIAAQSIRYGESDAIIAGGVESMSRTAFMSEHTRWGAKLQNVQLVDGILLGLFDPASKMRMDETAEKLAKIYNISREEQDEFALLSQQRAEAAIKEGKLKDEIMPIEIKTRKGPTFFDTDEHPKFGLSIDTLAKLNPAFAKEGTVTAGNASGINDGACAVLLMSEEKAKKLGIKPLAKILSYATAGVDPSIMGIGPVNASRNALKKIGMDISAMDLIECNEAFAAQYLSVEKELKLNREIVNVNGGAIALGHPVSASGPRLLTTLIYELRRRDLKYGLATLCVGGGHGVSTVIERL